MYHRLLAIILMLSLSYQCFVKLGIVIWYECNKDYIAQNLCENRDRPEKKCCGKCYLNKQLKKTEQGSTETSKVPSKWNMGEVVVFTIPSMINLPFIAQAEHSSVLYKYLEYLPLGSPNEIFHPPSFC